MRKSGPGRVHLQFDSASDRLGSGKKLRDGLSLPSGSQAEADVEDLDIAGGYLWLVIARPRRRCREFAH